VVNGFRPAQAHRRLRLVSIVAPIAGAAVLYLVRLLVLRIWPAPAADVVVGVLVVAGVLAFSRAIFHVIDQQEGQLAQQHEQLALSAERERIRLLLQDGAIQTLYAVNLDLELTLDELSDEAGPVAERIDRSIDRLGMVMRDIRRCILGKELLEADDGRAHMAIVEREERCG
jgi:signal transduction histidine kinase